jgi:hypothetical protein
MNNNSSMLLGLTIAVALVTGSQMVEHPFSKGEAPGAFNDITIAEADNQKVTTGTEADKGLPPPQTSPQVQAPTDQSGEAVGEGQKNKGVPPAAAVSPNAPSETR